MQLTEFGGRLKRHATASGLTRHLVRIVSALAKTGFWLAAYHYYGPKAFLYVSAAWLLALGAKDLTFWRIRLRRLHRPTQRTQALWLSIWLELGLLAVRLALTFGLSLLVGLFSPTVASVLVGLMLCTIFWSRETLNNLMRVYEVGALRIYIVMLGAIAGIGTIIACAETGRTAIVAAVAGLVVREAVQFFGMTLIVIAGRFGLRAPGDDVDEDEGGAEESVAVSGGREVRSTWKLLIADNIVWSRWRLIQFGTRYAATGLLGPFGGFASRMLFSYRKPGAYKHRETRLSAWKIAGMALLGATSLTVLIMVAARWGLIHALGLTLAASVFRLVAIVANTLLWRQLSPLVGMEGKIPSPIPQALRRKA